MFLLQLISVRAFSFPCDLNDGNRIIDATRMVA